MASSCISTGTMSDFLAGRLTPAEEEIVEHHLDACERCEGLARDLSDDADARALAAASARHIPSAVERAQIDDFCRRLQALQAYELALQLGAAGQQGDTSADDNTTGDSPFLHSSKAPAAAAWAPPGRLGRYEVVRPVGAGAFGIVYLARDERLHRNVALKIARPSVLSDPILKARFFREAEALARLDHPNIVPVYEAGESDGLSFVALAYCDGPTLHDWLKEHPGPHDPRFVVRLVLPLVEAVEHAHSRGILHRDVKPGNILLAAAGSDEPPRDPKLTDFGLAKVLEQESSETLAGVILGTACNMSPEQAAGHLERIGPPTDVYALGTVLYELLGGRVPISGSTTIDTLRRLLIDEPAELRSLSAGVPEDLEAIVRKCLQKSPSQRYPTARELADDLSRFLAGQPTKARPLSATQRLVRWSRRHKTLVPLLLLAASVIGLSLGLLLYARRLSRSELAMQQAVARLGQVQEHAQSREVYLAHQAYARDLFAAGKATSKGDIPSAVAALRRQMPGPGEPDLRGLSWHLLWSLNTHSAQAFADAGTEIYHLRLSPGGQELAAVGQDGWLRLYHTADMSLRAVMPTGQIEANCVSFASAGHLAATAGDDGTIRVFDLDTRQQKLRIAAHPDKAFGVVFFDDDRQLASCGKDPVIRLWDAATGAPLGTLAGHTAQVEAIDISPKGDQLVSASSDRTAVLWDLASQQSRRVLRGHDGAVLAASFSPDGRWVATGSADNTVAIWNARSGARASVEPQLDEVQTVAFSSDGQRLLVGDRSGSVHRYRFTNPNRRIYLRPDPPDPRWQAHASRIWHATAGSTPDSFYTSGKDGFVRRWDDNALARSERTIAAPPGELPVDLEFSPDGRLLLALSESRGITVYDATTLQPERTLDCRHSQWRTLRLLGRRHVAAGNAHGVVAIWDHETGELCRILSFDEHEYPISGLAATADGALLAISSDDFGTVRVYETATGRLVGEIAAGAHFSVALSPDGRSLALDSLDDIVLYELPSRRLRCRLAGHAATIRSLAFSPDGQLLASGSGDRTVRIWTVEGTPLATLTGHLADLSEVQFSPDGRSLISVDDRGRAQLTHVATRQTVFELPVVADRLHGTAIAPESRRMAAIRTWRDSHEIVIVGATR